jgi:membrane-associated phospholipid phosphatase
VSIALTSVVVNAALKPVWHRTPAGRDRARRPDRPPRARLVPLGHSASAVAFATGATATAPWAPTRTLAALVAYSRVHTGVHCPGDVLGGTLLGVVRARPHDVGPPRRR